MKSLIALLIFNLSLYSSVQSLQCSDNPCKLNPNKQVPGFQCIQVELDKVVCTCPQGDEVDKPCRPCNRPDPADNICKNTTGKLIICLDDDAYGSNYGCLCMDPSTGKEIVTLDPNCDTSNPVTTQKPTPAPLPCQNGGVTAYGICNCPSGTSGSLCDTKEDRLLCDRISCKNNGVCAIQKINGVYQSVCLCRAGFSGEYCELTGTSGFCSASSCQNNAACREAVVGTTRNAYCHCSAGYSGVKCESRHFTCLKAGNFTDTNMVDQGKYFECKSITGSAAFRIEQKSCPKGLRFSQSVGLCTY